MNTSPMFPRFHVNDTEKGGPRAPPRNKMALYEQLSIPSQSFNTPMTSLLPLPLDQGGSLASSAPLLFGGANQRYALTPLCSSAVTHLARKAELHASAGVKLNSLMETREINLMQARGSTHFKRVAPRKHRDADDFTIPALVKRVLTPHSDRKCNKNLKLNPDLHMDDSSQSKSSREKQIDPTRSTSMKSRQCARNPLLDNQEVSSASHERPVTLCRENTDASFPPSSKDKISETSKGSHASIIGECRSSSVDGLACSNTSMGDGCHVQQDISVVRGEVLEELSKGNASRLRSRLRSKPLIENGKRGANGTKCDNKDHEDGEYPIQAAEGNGCNVLDSLEESPSSLYLLPDDVVGVIGEKHYWNARKAIVNQQRIFAAQVFELHRLIRVQRLLSRSPHLLGSSLYFGNPLVEHHAIKSVPSERLIEATTLLKSNSLSTQERNPTPMVKLPLPPIDSDFSKKLVGERPEQSHYSETSNPAACEPTLRCFPRIGNQWLVPMMSPSEGLIYNSYSAVCPPRGGTVGPLYGGCAPISFESMGNDVGMTFGIPASQRQAMGILPRTSLAGQTFFLPWGIPLTNPSVASSAIEPMSNPFILGSQSNPQVNQRSTGEVNISRTHQSSCNVSTQVSRVISCDGLKSPTVKENELQGSTGSNPSEKLGGAALPLFPIDPTKSDQKVQVHSSNRLEKVIKVVPHNPRSAAESAARIFQSIQEERKRHE
ncbi:hypothetical protein ACJRO7_024969 [Eucalyptus globulus]|uniref:Uncharacterized protein n=2 Tax=Eucalyptus globulus TaxID=34317 RepID=A0ABD3K9C5_EUCGL